MSNYIINTAAKAVCRSLEDITNNVSIGQQNLQIGNLLLTAAEYDALAAADTDITLFAQDYTVTRKDSETTTSWSWSESAAMTAGKINYDIAGQNIEKVTLAGFGNVNVTNSSLAGIYATECLDTDDYISNLGFAGTFAASENYKESATAETDTYTFNKKANAAGNITLTGSNRIGNILGYAQVKTNGSDWDIGNATTGKQTFKRTENYVNSDESYSVKADVAAMGAFEATGNGKVSEIICFQTVKLTGNGTQDVFPEGADTPKTIGNLAVLSHVLGGKFNQSYSYSIKNGEEDYSESYSLSNSQAAYGTFTAAYADGTTAEVQGFATVTLDAYATNFNIHTGKAKDTKKGSQKNGSVLDIPNSVTIERYATGAATLKSTASAAELLGFDKVTLDGDAETINRDSIRNFMPDDSMFQEGLLEDMTQLIGDIEPSLLPDSSDVSGKLAITNSFDKYGMQAQTTTAYTAKKGGTLTVTENGTVTDAFGYGTVTVTGGAVTGTLAQDMMDKWTYVKTFTYEPDYDENGAFSNMETSAKGKLTVTAGSLGAISGYGTVKFDGLTDKKTKEVLEYSTVTGTISAETYKYTYNSKTFEENQTLKSTGSATLSNTFLKGNIEGMDKVTLTNVTWNAENEPQRAGDIMGGTRTSSVNGKKGNSDVFDLLGTAKLTSSHVSGIYGMKSITMTDSSALEIACDSQVIADRWNYEEVPMAYSAKMAGTITLTDSTVSGDINGYATLTVKNSAASKTSPVPGTSVIGAYIGTDGADKVTFTNGTVIVGNAQEDTRAVTVIDAPTVLDFKDGKNTLTIAKATTLIANGDITFGDGDDTLSHSGAFLSVQAISMGEGKNTVDIKKGATLALNGAVDLGSNKASTMKVGGEVLMLSQQAMSSLTASTQVKAAKTAIFATTSDIWDAAAETVIGTAKVYDIGSAEEAPAYSGYANETADDTYKKALLADDAIGSEGWLSQDDGTGRYLNDTVDFFKLGDVNVAFEGNVTTTYYDTKGKLTTDASAYAYVAVGLAPETTGVVKYSVIALA